MTKGIQKINGEHEGDETPEDNMTSNVFRGSGFQK
jgi:hypothetical protein